ncbi:hypothetical protein [Salinigranum halophilum]|jgi:hypothetical protein|uniref:hypothetical protein n=1 Tax=Salinigranum halophilum TaxID=2565931 RepID=UPI0010A91084|nr:hypothetical protein [Salinigranum halophilum]
MSPSALSRRRFLSGTVLAVVLGGCSGAPSDGSDAATASTSTTPTADATTATAAPTTGRETATAAPTTASGTETEPAGEADATRTAVTSASAALDLREANVVGVEVEPSGDAARFSVTLYHDDDGEDGYADWWQVETLDGDRLGRRTLLHAHGTAPFTRSERLSVPDGVRHVVVRGHDQTHGYGGQAMVVDLETGATAPVRQGPEPRDLSSFEPTS